jgi:hypothetical protein
VTDAFADLGKEVAEALGAPHLATTVIAHPLGELQREQVAARARAALPEIMTALLSPPEQKSSSKVAAPARMLDLHGTWDAINGHFYARGWTDGLPIAVPAEHKVAALLRGARAAPEDVLGVIPPRMSVATVENIAVNAVMAGCEPEHFPVVLAAVTAMCDPRFNLLPMQATTNPVTPLIVVNGPIAHKLQINAGSNVLGQGWKSNAVIGRALRFVLVNIGGGAPGKLDQACHGQPGKLSFCIAENESASPWEPFHVERGFAPHESTVSVIGVAGTQDIIHYARTSAEHILTTLARAIPRDGLKNLYSGGEPLLIFGPEQAAVLGAAGLSKKDVKTAFFESTHVPIELLASETLTLLRGRRSEYFAHGDPRAVPIADSAAHVQILVAGGAGNHTVFLPTWGDTYCVTVKIDEGV